MSEIRARLKNPPPPNRGRVLRTAATSLIAAASLAFASVPVGAADLLIKNANIVDPIDETIRPGAMLIDGAQITEAGRPGSTPNPI